MSEIPNISSKNLFIGHVLGEIILFSGMWINFTKKISNLQTEIEVLKTQVELYKSNSDPSNINDFQLQSQQHFKNIYNILNTMKSTTQNLSNSSTPSNPQNPPNSPIKPSSPIAQNKSNMVSENFDADIIDIDSEDDNDKLDKEIEEDPEFKTMMENNTTKLNRFEIHLASLPIVNNSKCKIEEINDIECKDDDNKK